jgi:hypothetical protein
MTNNYVEKYKMVINRNDWSGNEVDIDVILLSISENMVAYRIYFEEDTYFLNVTGAEAFLMNYDGEEIASGAIYKGLWSIGNDYIQRESGSPVIAAVQALCNL